MLCYFLDDCGTLVEESCRKSRNDWNILMECIDFIKCA